MTILNLMIVMTVIELSFETLSLLINMTSTTNTNWLISLFSSIKTSKTVHFFAAMLTGLTVLGVSSYYFIKLRRE